MWCKETRKCVMFKGFGLTRQVRRMRRFSMIHAHQHSKERELSDMSWVCAGPGASWLLAQT